MNGIELFALSFIAFYGVITLCLALKLSRLLLRRIFHPQPRFTLRVAFGAQQSLPTS